MGLTIVAISHCEFETDVSDSDFYLRHDLIAIYGENSPEFLDGCKEGFYRYEPRNKFVFQVGSYSYFHWWRNLWAQMIVSANLEEVFARPEDFAQKPFFEMFRLPDYTGVVGPNTSRKLHLDFTNHQIEAGQIAEGNFFESYQTWMSAFYIAQQDGFVILC